MGALRSNILEITVDREAMTISAGGYYWLEFAANSHWTSIVGPVTDESISAKKTTYKQQNQRMAEKLGMNPTQWFKVWQALMIDLWIDPVKELANRYCIRAGGKYDPELLSELHNQLDLVEQAESDGIGHIVPFILLEGRTPKELKELWGKSLWKKLCANSMSRNILICRRAKMMLRSAYTLAEDMEKLSETSSTALKNAPPLTRTAESLKWASDQLAARKKLSRKGLYPELIQLYGDTYTMAVDQEEPFNGNWSSRRMLEEHDRLTVLRTAAYRQQRHQKEGDWDKPFDWVEDFTGKELTDGVFTAFLLDSPQALSEEGAVMGHCVGSYFRKCKKPESLIYSIRSGGQNLATAQFSRHSQMVSIQPEISYARKGNIDPNDLKIHRAHRISLRQLYGKYNQKVTDPGLLNFVDELEKKQLEGSTHCLPGLPQIDRNTIRYEPQLLAVDGYLPDQGQLNL